MMKHRFQYIEVMRLRQDKISGKSQKRSVKFPLRKKMYLFSYLSLYLVSSYYIIRNVFFN